jgi:hypothetical protein
LLEFARYGYALSRHWFLLVSAMFHWKFFGRKKRWSDRSNLIFDTREW